MMLQYRTLIITVLLLLSACTPTEEGVVTFFSCPTCTTAYEGFATCAFFDADKEFANPNILVDDQNYQGIGTPIVHAGYMHHKFCYNETDVAFGSANPTKTGLELNTNYVVHIQSKTLANAFSSEYEQLLHEGSGRHTKTWTFNNRPITVLFCPRDECEEHVVAELEKAERSITFLAFSFTSDAIGDAVVAKHKQGIVISGVMEPLSATGRGGEYTHLKDAGINVRLVNTPGLMHAKAFVIDETTAIIGSYNPTANANTKNAETIVITQEPAVVQGVLELFARTQ